MKREDSARSDAGASLFAQETPAHTHHRQRVGRDCLVKVLSGGTASTSRPNMNNSFGFGAASNHILAPSLRRLNLNGIGGSPPPRHLIKALEIYRQPLELVQFDPSSRRDSGS